MNKLGASAGIPRVRRRRRYDGHSPNGPPTGALEAQGARCKDELGVERIELQIEPDSLGSQRAALAAGFVEDGVVREREPVGEARDMVLFLLDATGR
jgi:RimJ/RimL family protein N-acetyltransferase